MSNNSSGLAPESMRILVADDHCANRILSQSLLQRCGHDVSLAKNGEQALERCSTEIFDAILLDIIMPVMDGIEALKSIKNLKNGNQQAPIFALTTHSGDNEMKEIIAIGFDAVLQKPFNVSDMMQHINHPFTENDANYCERCAPAEMNENFYKNALKLPLLEVQTIDILLEAYDTDQRCQILRAYWAEAQFMMFALRNTRVNNGGKACQELVGLRKIANRLKGASASIGLLKASQLSAHLQNAPIENVPFLLNSLGQALEESKSVICDYYGFEGDDVGTIFSFG